MLERFAKTGVAEILPNAFASRALMKRSSRPIASLLSKLQAMLTTLVRSFDDAGLNSRHVLGARASGPQRMRHHFR